MEALREAEAILFDEVPIIPFIYRTDFWLRDRNLKIILTNLWEDIDLITLILRSSGDNLINGELSFYIFNGSSLLLNLYYFDLYGLLGDCPL